VALILQIPYFDDVMHSFSSCKIPSTKNKKKKMDLIKKNMKRFILILYKNIKEKMKKKQLMLLNPARGGLLSLLL